MRPVGLCIMQEVHKFGPMTISSLTPEQLRAITWRYALGHGGVTRVAGRTGYSPQQVSHILLGRKGNPIIMAYVAGMAGEPWPVAEGLVAPESPAVLVHWWRVNGRLAWMAGKKAERFDGPGIHAAYNAVVREVTAQLRTAHVAAPRVRAARKTLNPPVEAGGPRRRVQRTTAGDTSAGNGPRTTVTDEPMRDARAPLGGASRAPEPVG